jgi:hypothetical protein
MFVMWHIRMNRRTQVMTLLILLWSEGGSQPDALLRFCHLGWR